MSSIFDLKQSVSELSGGKTGMSRMQYEQITATRDAVGDRFADGRIEFKFSVAGQKWWIPSRTYIRMRATLTKPDGTQLDYADNIAPNMGLMSNLFQSAEFNINNKTVSRIGDFMPQIDALNTRLSKSKAWLDSVGASTNMWQSREAERRSVVSADGVVVQNSLPLPTVTTGRVALGFDALNTIAYDSATGILSAADGGGVNPPNMQVVFPIGSYIKILGGAFNGVIARVAAHVDILRIVVEGQIPDNIAAGVVDFARVVAPDVVGDPSRRVSGLELIYQPPLSLMKVGHALPAGDYSLILNPHNSATYKKKAIESILADKTPTTDGANNDYQFNIETMYLYVATVEGERADDMTYILDLEEVRCQTQKVDSAAFQQKHFTVSPSSYALTACFQDQRGNDTRYSATKYIVAGAQAELKLNRFFINYAGQSKPNPDADPEYKAGNAKDYTVQRYAETQLASGAYFDTGGGETIEEWHARGPYYHFSWPRDGKDRSTLVNVHYGFEAGTDMTEARLLLFDHHRKAVVVEIRDGKVFNLTIQED